MPFERGSKELGAMKFESDNFEFHGDGILINSYSIYSGDIWRENVMRRQKSR